jgi:hypothetical protein
MPRPRQLVPGLVVFALITSGWLANWAESAEPNRGTPPPAKAPATLAVVSEDPYTNPNTFHRTLAEPDSLSFGSTIVSTFQAGRAHTCGSSNLGWSVSKNAGTTWTDGFLPGTTIHATPPGPWIRATDPVVAYDAKHDTWLVEGLGFPGCDESRSVFVNRATDGAQTFDEPVVVRRGKPSQDFDKNWIACDNTMISPFFGNCYTAWDDEFHHFRMHASASSDGGLTWTKVATPKDSCVFAVQPVVRPDGTVVIPYLNACNNRREAYVSTDGGENLRGPFAIRRKGSERWVAGRLASPGIQNSSSDVDASGKMYTAWADCSFRPSRPGHGCGTHNDIVLSTSEDGRHWTDFVRIPIDPVRSSVDHFFPAIAVDPETLGDEAHIAVLYYFYPVENCTLATCELLVGFISSTDGGSSWSDPIQLAGPFNNTWFPLRDDGYFPGDYFSVSFIGGKAVPVFTVAAEGDCELGDIPSCNTWIASATITLPSGA